MVGMRVRPVPRGVKEVKVRAVHGFRSRKDYRLGMTQKLRYCDSGKSLGRKLN
mgnify:CR=1 FL=1